MAARRSRRRAGAHWRTIGAASAVTVALSGCAGLGGVTPTVAATHGGFAAPTATTTTTPAPNGSGRAGLPQIDPRCVRQFPGKATLVDEADLEGRPDFWPPVPEWAALCYFEWENEETQVGWYATDGGVSRAEIYRMYEHALLGMGTTGRAHTAEGEIVTGVVQPGHSFWVFAGRDQFRVTWSYDGEYAD